MLTYGSLFAGIKGDKGFTDAGWDCRWAVEIEPFCCAVLRTHYPHLPIFGDIRGCGSRNLERVELITAGVPCQDVSVVGKRSGLRGERTGLFYEFARILRELRPAWFVFENVPGLFSSNSGRDFAEVLRVLMVECGYGVSWRVLNSQFFGVAQRRRRVFVVGRFGKPCPPEILFESASSGGDSAAGGEAGKRTTERPGRGVAGSLKGASLSRRTVNSEEAADGYLVARRITQSAFKRHDEDTDTLVAATLTERFGGTSNQWPPRNEADNLIAVPLSAGSCDCSHPGGRRREDDFNLVPVSSVRRELPGQVCDRNSDAGPSGVPEVRRGNESPIVIQDVRGGARDRTDNGQGIGIREGGPCYTLGAVEQHAVAFAENQRGELRTSEIAPQLSAGGGKPGSGYSAITFDNGQGDPNFTKPGEPTFSLNQQSHGGVASKCAEADADGMRDVAGLPEGLDDSYPFLPKGLDSARYRALGNAWTVQVGRWLAERLKAEILKS